MNKSSIKCENWQWPRTQVLLLHGHGYQIPQFQNFIIFPIWLLYPTTSKPWYPCYGFLILQFQNFTNLLPWNCSRLAIALFIFLFFLEIGRNYIMSIMSIIITIVSNVTVLVSQNIIFFGFSMPMSHGVNNKTPPSVSPHLPLPYQVFARFVYCFTRNVWSTFNSCDQVICER